MTEKLQAMLAGEVRPRDPNNQQSIAPRPRRAARAFMGLYLPLLRSSAGFLPCSPIFFSFGSAGGQPLPKVCPDTSSKPSEGLAAIFQVDGDATEYAKLIFWCFVAGSSERFVTDIVCRFDSSASEHGKPATKQKANSSTSDA